MGQERACVTEEQVEKWFDELKSFLIDEDPSVLLESDRIYNADESGFSVSPGTGHVIAQVGQKDVYAVTSNNKQQITVLACAGAAGDVTRPMLIFPGKNFHYNPLDGFEDAFFGKSERGWIDSELFANWLEAVFVPHVANKKKPVLLLVDGHSSHQSLRASKICSENGIILYCLLQHASHILQPLDVGLFSPMKANWKNAVKDFQDEYIEVVSKKTFAKVFKLAWEKSVAPSTIKNAFRHAGIYPLDPSKINKEKLRPSDVFKSTGGQTTENTVTVAQTTSEHGEGNVEAQSERGQTAVNESSATSTSSSATSTSSKESSIPSTSSSTDHTLDKLLMLTSQIGEATLQLYQKRFQEGYDLQDDALYNLWKKYYEKVASRSVAASAQHPSPAIEKNKPMEQDMFEIPRKLTTGSRKRKMDQVPRVISGVEFQKILQEKEDAKKRAVEEKEERKKQRLEKKEAKAREIQKKKEDKEKKKKETAQRKVNKKNVQNKARKAQTRKRNPEESTSSSDTDLSNPEDEIELEKIMNDHDEDSFSDAPLQAKDGEKKCHVCDNTRNEDQLKNAVGEINWIACSKLRCARHYHAACVRSINLNDFIADDLKEMDDFVCDECL